MKPNPKNSINPSNYPLTMYMLQKGKLDEGRSSRPSLRVSTNRTASKSISSCNRGNLLIIKPLKKDTSRIANNNASNKRFYALSANIQLSFKQRIEGIASFFSVPDSDSNIQSYQPYNSSKQLLNSVNEMFAIKYKSAHSAYCNLTQTDIMSVIQRIVENFRDIFHQLSSCFLAQQQKIITNYQKNIFNIGKQFDSLSEKLRQEQKKSQKLQHKIKKLVKILQQKNQRGNFTTQIFTEMEAKSINVEQWIFQSNAFKKIAEDRGFIRSERLQNLSEGEEVKFEQDKLQKDSQKQIVQQKISQK